MSNLRSIPSNMYYNVTTGDIKEIIPFVGGNGLATSVVPEGYKRLSKLVANETFTTINDEVINAGDEGGYVCVSIPNDIHTDGYGTLEDIFKDQTKAWVDAGSKILDNISFSGDVCVKSSTLKGSGEIIGSVVLSSCEFSLLDNSSINFRKFRTINTVVITGNVRLSGDMNLSNSTINTYNFSLRASCDLTLKSSTLKLKKDLEITSNFTITDNNNVTLGGNINGTLRIDTESNNCVVNSNVSIDSDNSIIIGPNTEVIGSISVTKGSTVTITDRVNFVGSIEAVDSTVTIKGKTRLSTIITAYYGSTITISSTENSTYDGSIKTFTNSSFTSTSLGNGGTVLNGDIICKGEVVLTDNSKIEGTQEFYNLRVSNTGYLAGGNVADDNTNVIVRGNGKIQGYNKIKSDLTVEEEAKFLPNSNTTIETNGLLLLGDNVQISGVCTIKGRPSILNNAQIKSCVLIDGSPTIKDNAIVDNIYCIDSNALIEDNATVGGDLYLTGDVAIGGNMYIVITGPVDGDIEVSRYDANTIYNYGRFYFDWRVTSPYQMSLVITPLKEPIYFYLKSTKHSESFMKLPDRENTISLASLSTEINILLAYIADEKSKGSTNEDLKTELGRLRRISQYYYLSSTFLYHFCKTQNFDITSNVLELEPLTLFKC